MRVDRVKMFKGCSVANLEEQINDFLVYTGEQVVDVKISSTSRNYSTDYIAIVLLGGN